MEIPCTCGYDRSVCVDCMQDHIDSLHDNLRKLVGEMGRVAIEGIDPPITGAESRPVRKSVEYILATSRWRLRIKQILAGE